MTEQSSSKSFFGIYLRYRIRQQKMNFVLCVILNVLSFPLLALAMEKGILDQTSDFYNVGRIGSMVSGILLIVLAVAGAVMSFEFYNTKNLTDTLGVLPITDKQRFFGDLIGGYVVNVSPVIPCGIFAAIRFTFSQEDFEKLLEKNELELSVSFGEGGLSAVVSLFIILTMSYLITAFVTSACGKVFHSLIFSVFMIAGLPVFFGGIAGCFAVNMLGVDSKEIIWNTMMFFPPITHIKKMFDFSNILEFLGKQDFYEIDVTMFKPVYFIVWAVLAAGLIAGAYFIAKKRKIENVGSAFIFRPMFYIVCAIVSGGSCALILAIGNYNRLAPHIPVTAILSGAVMCVVMLLLWIPKKKYLLHGIISGAGSVFLAFGLCVLFDKTGCLGARYFPKNSAKIEYIRIDDFITITDKDDIHTYTRLLHNRLRNYSKDIKYSVTNKIEYKLSNGKTVERSYSPDGLRMYMSAWSHAPRIEMSFDNYGKYYFNALDEVHDIKSCFVDIRDGRINVPQERFEEFFEILRGEAETKYKCVAEVYGTVNFTENGSYKFKVQSDFTETIEFLEGLKEGNFVEPSAEKTYLRIGYVPDRKNDNMSLYVEIKNKNRNSELVKELESLLKKVPHNDKNDPNFRILDNSEYYVPKENSGRVLEIMMQIALE